MHGTISHILSPEKQVYAKEAILLTHDKIFNSGYCPMQKTCTKADIEHRITCHTTRNYHESRALKLEEIKDNSHPFLLDIDEDVEFDDLTQNIIIGFHQTSLFATKKILADAFIKSKQGMLGEGIYFATSREATEIKVGGKGGYGSYFCAKISLGKVKTITAWPSEGHVKKAIPDGFNSLYLKHQEGPTKDEFIITSTDQILDMQWRLRRKLSTIITNIMKL